MPSVKLGCRCLANQRPTLLSSPVPTPQVLKLKKWLVLMGWEHGMKPDEVSLRGRQGWGC